MADVLSLDEADALPAQGGQAAPAQASGPEVLSLDEADALQPANEPTHPTAAPSGDALADTGNFLTTAIKKGAAGVYGFPGTVQKWLGYGSQAPTQEQKDTINEYRKSQGLAPLDSVATRAPTVTQQEDRSFSQDAPEYVPQTAAGRYAMAGATGAVGGALSGGAGSVAGVARNAAIGSIGGDVSQGLADAGANPLLAVPLTAAAYLAARGGAAGVKAAAPAVRNVGRGVLAPSSAGRVNAGRVLADVSNTDEAAVAANPSNADMANATGAVKSATADIGQGAPANEVGEQIRSDLNARQAALKGARTAATAPLAAARDASTAKINTDPVVATIADKLKTAAGSQADALNGALKDLKMPSGELRTQSDQLAASRQAISARITQAKAAGDGATVKHLSDVRDALDAQVAEAVPEAGQFNATYQAYSRPTDVFQNGKQSVNAVPRVVSRDSFGNPNGTPASEIPDSFLRGNGTKEKLDQLVEAYGGDRAAAEKALEQHLAAKASEAVNPDGTLDPYKFAKVMQPYQKALSTQAPASPPTPGATVAAEARRQAAAKIAEIDGSVPGPSPSSPLAPSPGRVNLGNTGVWFPGLQKKFATAQAAQKTLDTMKAQRGVAESIANGELRNADGTITGQSFNAWLRANKDGLAASQSPQAVSRLQQIGKALARAKNDGVETFATEIAPTVVGAATGGVEGGILGGMMHKLAAGLYSPIKTRTDTAFNAAIERAVQDPAFARQLVSALPQRPYSIAEATRLIGKAVDPTTARAPTPAVIAAPSTANRQNR